LEWVLKKTLVLCALVSGLFADGKSLYEQNCAACHGANGKDSAVSGKSIAGQSQADIDAKLIGYKKGSIGGAGKESMQASLANISDADLKTIAAFVANLK
jgi:cytochrome c553